MKPPSDKTLEHKTCLVTGASSGIGRATALGLAGLGANVVLVCRNPKRGEKTLRWIRKKSQNEAVHLLLGDLSRQQDIFDVAMDFKNRFDRLDVLINNAGLVTRKRRLTPEGFELQFFVNHLAYYLLTGSLLDVLERSSPSRIINVASTAHSRGVLDFDNLQGEKRYNGWQQYSNTKLANIVFTYELARRLAGSDVTANCLHPGVIHTNLMSSYSRIISWTWHLLQWFFKNPEEGAETPLYLASSPEVRDVSGRYFKYCAPLGSSPESCDRNTQRRLWESSEELTGFTYPELSDQTA
jgi:NAD(P)-dependent dehydrogenase (short-subunit alcohol dehydrogenase family)